MSNEDLMKPRWMVVASYPGSQWPVGSIMQQAAGSEGFVSVDSASWPMISAKLVKAHPHLFAKLRWWQNRDTEDMPAYLRCVHVESGEPAWGRIYKVESYPHDGCANYVSDGGVIGGNLNWFAPATESEYLAAEPKRPA